MGTPITETDIETLDRAAARTWRGTEEEALGGWLLRAAGGFTGRANSVLAVGDPGLPLAAAGARGPGPGWRRSAIRSPGRTAIRSTSTWPARAGGCGTRPR